MMTPDILKLKAFYATPFGEQVRQLIMSSILRLWPDIPKECTLGIGFATPYLEAYLGKGALVTACMPARQGAAYWPANRTNLVFLSHESELPLPENSMNRVLLVHCVETTDQLEPMLRDIWRVLTPGGRVLVVASNRLGLWSRSSRSPFGFGLPFSTAQLKTLLTEHDFTISRSASALFLPPTYSRLLWRAANVLERIGKTLCLNVGGVALLEAEKQIYAGIQQPSAARNYKKVPAARPIMTMNKG